MWERVRWPRLLITVLAGLVIGYYADGWSLALSIAVGFLVGGLVFELWFGPWLQARLDRRFDDEERRRR